MLDGQGLATVAKRKSQHGEVEFRPTRKKRINSFGKN